MSAPLIDTHVWIWWMDGDERLPRRIRALDLPIVTFDERIRRSRLVKLWQA